MVSFLVSCYFFASRILRSRDVFFVSYVLAPHQATRSAATARRIRVASRPPTRPQPRPPPVPTARAEEVRLRRRLEVKGDRVCVRVGVERLLVEEDRATCARHAKCKSAESFESDGIELSPQVREGWRTPHLRAPLRGHPATFGTPMAKFTCAREPNRRSSAPRPSILAVRAGAHHAPAPGAISASARAPRGRPRHEPWLKRSTSVSCPLFCTRIRFFNSVLFGGRGYD